MSIMELHISHGAIDVLCDHFPCLASRFLDERVARSFNVFNGRGAVTCRQPPPPRVPYAAEGGGGGFGEGGITATVALEVLAPRNICMPAGGQNTRGDMNVLLRLVQHDGHHRCGGTSHQQPAIVLLSVHVRSFSV